MRYHEESHDGELFMVSVPSHSFHILQEPILSPHMWLCGRVSWDLVINRFCLLLHPALLCPAFPKINLEYCGSNMTCCPFLEFTNTYEHKENAVRTWQNSRSCIYQPRNAKDCQQTTRTEERDMEQILTINRRSNFADALIMDNKFLLLNNPNL